MSTKIQRRVNVAIGALILLFLVAAAAEAQTRVEAAVIAAGATESRSTSIVLKGTLGQTVVGKASAGDQLASLGFWRAEEESQASSVSDRNSRFNEVAATRVNCYPNPVKGIGTVQIEVESRQDVSLHLYDALGRSVAELVDESVGSGVTEFNFDASRLTPGIYSAVLVGERSNSVKKFVVAE